MLALLCTSSCLPSIRYFALNGTGIPDASRHNRFRVRIRTSRYTHVLEAANHRYRTQVPLVGDPCVWELASGGRPVGRLDLCEGLAEYSLGGRAYTARRKGGHAAAVGEAAISEAAVDRADGHAAGAVPADARPYRIGVFVFNGAGRARALGRNVNRETEELMRLVDGIYAESGTGIRVVLAGVLSMRDELRGAPNILGAFRRLVEPIKYDPHNLDTPLSRSDLSLLVAGSPVDGGAELGEHHGMSYFGGSNGLSRAYGVVYAGPGDSRYFLAKKIAHEVAHSLGVHHDDDSGFIMEPSTCASCDDSPRAFSSQSRAQMARFVEEYADTFRAESSEDEGPDRVVVSREEARAYIRRRRRHSFNDIVARRLGGRVPETSYFTYYLGLSLVFYLVSICTAIYYLK